MEDKLNDYKDGSNQTLTQSQLDLLHSYRKKKERTLKDYEQERLT